jgi:dipeptidase D
MWSVFFIHLKLPYRYSINSHTRFGLSSQGTIRPAFLAPDPPGVTIISTMSTAIDHLQPQAVWKHFAALAAIPRASEKEAAARDYVLALAARLGLESVQDSVGNLVVRKPARPGREAAVPAVIQGHLDMVCEKNEGTAHNFDTDPIRLIVDGDWLKADGTTLGADNGVGVAAALAVMESDSVAHGPLELVFTIDEESGLTGASKFPGGLLRSQYFLNLDNEEEDTLCIGCAGGINSVARRKIAREAAPSGDACRIKIAGHSGGHSGVDIHRGRGNALRILGGALLNLMDALPLSVADIRGGSKRNAIPREASAIVILPSGHAAPLKAILEAYEAEVRTDLGAFDPGLRISVEAAERPQQAIARADARLIAGILAAQHHGVLAMSPDIPGLVQTSTNLATVATSDGQVEIATSQRSPIESSKRAAARMVATVFGFAGFTVEQSGDYPGWKPEPGSDIVRTAQAVHQDVLGRKPELIAMHAGLECGVIGEKYPGMQMISFGPHIVDVHSPSERIKISSVGPFYRLLTGLLERI